METAQRRRIDAAMLQSLASTFRMLNDGMPLCCSFNYGDVAEMLDRCATAVEPGPAAIRSMGEKG